MNWQDIMREARLGCLAVLLIAVGCQLADTQKEGRKTMNSHNLTPEQQAMVEMIGVGKAHWFEPPLPPNRTCGSPASGSPVSGVHGGTDRSARGLRPW